MTFLYSVVGFVVALGILITVHEFGHYWVAKRLGVKVLRFSIGFGRPLWVRRGGADDTEYVVAALPLGGYVKMLDENEEAVAEAEQHRAFNRQALWKRTAIVLAGPLFNFLFAILAYWLVFVGGIEGVKPVVGKVVEESIAAQGGFKVGDEIVSINQRPNRSWDENRLYLFNQAFQRRPVSVEVKDSEGVAHHRVLDLSQLSLREIDAGLVERGIGLIGYIPEIPAVVGGVQPDSPASSVGLRVGDRILKIDATPVADWRDLVEQVRDRPGQPIRLVVERDGDEVSLSMILERVSADGGEYGRIGIQPPPLELPDHMRVRVDYGPLEALGRGIENTWVMSALTLNMLVKIVQLEVSAKNISGPLTIAQYAGQTVRIGLDRFVLFLAIVSISLGVLNLLPIPVLDGGHLLYYLIEAVTGGPVSKQVLMWGQQIGLVVLFALMSLAFYNDIVRLLE
ncbi:MAG: RIP metalloprotease RseP [Gammaproteobacteria bacterium]|nr:RIP metalloprotease RseP [Gammaproteobacteria bacterium]